MWARDALESSARILAAAAVFAVTILDVVQRRGEPSTSAAGDDADRRRARPDRSGTDGQTAR